MKKTIVTITGIRPDFIRMSFVFKELDKNFNHILVHTGQHYDNDLSHVFFDQLNIRKPDYILESGTNSSNHFDQLSYLTKAIPELFKVNNIIPDLILFLGDSNSAGVSFPLKKEGYKILVDGTNRKLKPSEILKADKVSNTISQSYIDNKIKSKEKAKITNKLIRNEEMTKEEAIKAKKQLKENSLPPALSTRSNDRKLRSNK